MRTRVVAMLLAASVTTCSVSLARQGTSPAKGEAPASSDNTKPDLKSEPTVSRPGATGLLEVQAKDLPAQLLLGRRVEEVRRATKVIPAVVVVRDAGSYVEAIARWTPTVRYPVLMDDGSSESHEAIARFVRGFRPSRVVRWGDRGSASVTEGAITQAVARSLGWEEQGAGDADALASAFLRELWKQRKPQGLIVANPGDPAWTAAIALAAFRREPIAFVPRAKVPGTVSSIFSAAEADAFAEYIEGECGVLTTRVGLHWDGLGDDLDAVTLCLNCPVKVWTSATDQVALTDRVGRLGTTGTPGARWAWAGQIFGSPAEASYRAMCSLFLEPSRAWVFDGYPDTETWKDYDGTQAAEALRGAGIGVELQDTPNQSDRDWRARVAKPLDADLVVVTTKGNSDFFDLNSGTCKPGDVPMLEFPAAVHFTHSWSAQWPGNRDTIAGRWFERGAYAYVGSVQEPYLQAFVPSKALAMRFVTGGPWGLFARMDGGPFSKPWKVAVFGDPLAVFGDPLARAEADLPLERASNLAEDLPTLLKDEKFAEAIDNLLLLGRDEDVWRLVKALRAERRAAVSPDIVAAAILPTFRLNKPQDLIELYSLLPEGDAKNPILRDALWLSSPVLLDGQPDAYTLEVYRKNLRDDQLDRDALQLARAWSLHKNRAEAVIMLQELRSRYANPGQRQALEKAIAAYRSR